MLNSFLQDPADSYRCIFCATPFVSLKAKQEHSKVIIPNKKIVVENSFQVCDRRPLSAFYKCIFCGSSFSTKRGKTTHMNTCSGNPRNPKK